MAKSENQLLREEIAKLRNEISALRKSIVPQIVYLPQIQYIPTPVYPKPLYPTQPYWYGTQGGINLCNVSTAQNGIGTAS